MISNYHTHTPRCLHAVGTEREYIESAIESGLNYLGFSDHSPYFFSGDYYSDMRMRPNELENYVYVLEQLKKEYQKDIAIHIGLEAEYYPTYFHQLISLCEQYPIEYMILGQHHLKDEMGTPYLADYNTNPIDVIDYHKQCLEALKTGKFLYFAHPDLVNFDNDMDLYKREMKQLCLEAKELNIPLEINFHGIWNNRNYPNPVFWEIAGEVGNEVILGSDAHQPDHIYDPVIYEKAMHLVNTYHLHLLPDLEDRFLDMNKLG